MAWKNPWYNPSLAHHTPDGFRNSAPVGHQPGDLERWRRERKAAGLPKPQRQAMRPLSRSGGNPLSLTTCPKMAPGGWDTPLFCCELMAVIC